MLGTFKRSLVVPNRRSEVSIGRHKGYLDCLEKASLSEENDLHLDGRKKHGKVAEIHVTSIG